MLIFVNSVERLNRAVYSAPPVYSTFCLQCFDAVGWAAGRALSVELLAWLSVWSEVQMICIMVQLMPLPPIISCSSKIQNGLPFWYRLTQVALEKGR